MLRVLRKVERYVFGIHPVGLTSCAFAWIFLCCRFNKGENQQKQLEKIEHDWVAVSNIFYVHPYLGKIPNLTNIFQRGRNH